MARVRIEHSYSDFDGRGAGCDRGCEGERAAVEGILGHPESSEAGFLGALGMRDELARTRALEADAELANFDRHLSKPMRGVPLGAHGEKWQCHIFHTGFPASSSRT